MSKEEFDRFYEDFFQFAGIDFPRSVASEDDPVLALGYAWLMRVVRTLRAVGLLEENGMAHETSPLIRCDLQAPQLPDWQPNG